MSRTEFSSKIRKLALKRANDQCEGMLPTGKRCETKLSTARKYEFDHVICDQIGGKADLDNCAVLCATCHKAKTKRDAKIIAEAKRRESSRLGTKAPPKAKIPQRPKSEKPTKVTGRPEKLASLPFRSLYAKQ